ncbi:endophilin-B1-like [Tubulanus polymorphus]|uniref:endophilin-B1-like n=1 Tax=Tubulanus polymorphus TaxID=672921 RepID=UPI003DA44108
MDFKKFTSDATTLFSRAKQYTEEKLGSAEKTEYDSHFETLLLRADKTKEWTERILKQTECVLQPNPSIRYEQLIYEKVDKKKRDLVTNEEQLGQFMVDAGNEFGPGTSYGNALIKCGQAEMRIGLAQKEYINNAHGNFLTPLKNFLEGDMKTVQKERKILETKRLDLDAAKNKVRKAKAGQSKEQDEELAKAEKEEKSCQLEFDRQAEVTKLLLEGISSTHTSHLRCLNDFIESQLNYTSQCQQYLTDLQRDLGSALSVSVQDKANLWQMQSMFKR